MIFVHATIDLEPGTRPAFLAEMHKLVPLVRAEAGCILYAPATDADTEIPTQQRVGGDAVVVVEQWADLPALRAHLAAPHMAEYRQRVKDFVAGVRLQILQPA